MGNAAHIMRKAFKYKAKINRQTEINALNWLSLCQSLYNATLEQRITYYRQYRKSISCYEQIKQLPELKRQCPEFKTVGSQCLQDVVERVDKAFKAFFRRLGTKEKAGFPRFRSIRRYDSFTLKQTGWKLDGKYLDIARVGRFKLFLSRPIEGKIKTVSVIRSSAGQWYVCFSCDEVPARIFPFTDREAGIDVGISSFLVDSDSHVVDNPKYFRESEKLLRVRSRSLARRVKGSNRRKKARVLVSKAHEKVKNQRNDFLHKTANYYIKNYKTIYVEDLNIRGMVRNHHLAKSISDAGWGMFIKMLRWKAEEAAREVIKVSARYTSQKCSGCGELVKKSLAVRVHSCPHCGLVIDRDFNASLNIRAAGQAAQAST